MTTRFVPVVVVMPADDYATLVDMLGRTEMPAEARASIVVLHREYGWTGEMLMLGRFLSVVAEAERRQR
jgi:hypothetical protein